MEKKNFRNISIAVALSLLLLTAMQGVWMVRTYRSMNKEFEHKVTSALEKAAYDELISRNSPSRIKSISSYATNVGVYDDENIKTDLAGRERSKINYYIRNKRELESDSSNTNLVRGYSYSYSFGEDSVVVDDLSNLSASSVMSISVVRDTMKHTKRNAIVSLVMRSGEPNKEATKYCDSLFSNNLQSSGIDEPYRLSLIEKSDKNSKESELYGFGAELEGGDVAFELPMSADGGLVYRVAMMSPTRGFVGKMSWLILSSLAIVAVLVFTFIYLLRTLFRQKSLEQMRLDFTHNITHELRTPISVAAAANEALLDFGVAESKERREHYLRAIDVQLKNLTTMVERILSVSLHDDHKLQLTLEKIELKPLLEQTVEEFRLKAGEGVEVSLEMGDGVVLCTDSFHLLNVVNNLLDNAAKYSNPPVRVSVSASEVGSGFAEIVVRDNGLGMSRREQSHIFDKYYRVPTGDLHNVKGFGLGLYYAKTVVEAMGGTIGVESRVGKGSKFTIKLPCDER